MAVTKTPRFQLDQWSASSDPRPGRVDTNRIHALIESQAAKVYPSGVLSDRPATNIFGSFYLATDQGVDGRLYYNGGSGWVALNTVGGGGPGKPVVINGDGGEGSSLLAARADHTHALPLATRDNAGAMASQWAELCENASGAPTANSLAIRDSGGRLAIKDPIAAQHAATMDWVQNKVGSSGPFPGLMVRTGTGQSSVLAPTHGLHIANRDYVNSRTSRREWKTNWKPLTVGLNEILDLQPGTYDYKPDAPDTGEGVYGAMVEDVATVLPDLTTNGEDGRPERIRDRELVWVLVKAIQDLAGRVEALAEEVDRLYARAGEDDA